MGVKQQWQLTPASTNNGASLWLKASSSNPPLPPPELLRMTNAAEGELTGPEPTAQPTGSSSCGGRSLAPGR